MENQNETKNIPNNQNMTPEQLIASQDPKMFLEMNSRKTGQGAYGGEGAKLIVFMIGIFVPVAGRTLIFMANKKPNEIEGYTSSSCFFFGLLFLLYGLYVFKMKRGNLETEPARKVGKIYIGMGIILLSLLFIYVAI